MANEHMKKCSVFLAVKEMHIKTTLGFHPISVRTAIVRQQTIINAGEERNPSFTAGGNVNY
jgi:hypothetical protein